MLKKWWYVDNEDGKLERCALPQLKLLILFSEKLFETTTPIFPRFVRGFCFNWMCGTFWDRSPFGIPKWDGTHKYIFQRLFEEDGRCIFHLGKYKGAGTDMKSVKKLHRRIFRLKILHRQFHLISTVLVGKNTKKVKMEKFTTLAKILHCCRQWRYGQIPPLTGTLGYFFARCCFFYIKVLQIIRARVYTPQPGSAELPTL